MVICQITQKIPNTVNKGRLYSLHVHTVQYPPYFENYQHNGLGGDKCDVLSETFIYADVNGRYDVNVGIGIKVFIFGKTLFKKLISS